MPSPLFVKARQRPTVLIVIVALGFLLGMMWLVLAHYHSSSGESALAEMRARTERVQQLDTVLVRVLDAESGVRGYLLGQNPVYLQPYQAGPAEIEQAMLALRAADRRRGIEDPRLEELEALVGSRWALLTEAVEHGEGTATKSLRGGVGKQLTDELRDQVLAMQAETSAEIQAALTEAFERFAQSRQRNLALGIGVLGLLLILLFMLYREDRLRRHLAQMLQSENERLQRQVAARTAELSDLASYLTNAREAEQEHLARELHDELGSLLTAAKLDASWIARKLPADARAPLQSRFDRLFDSLSQVISLKRKVVADLRPPLLSDLGLVEALRSLASTGGIGEKDGVLDLRLPERLPELPQDVALALYRIAQEGLTNIRRYAQATEVSLTLSVEGDELVLRIKDNGVGFDPKVSRTNRHGLIGMAHRVQMLAGSLDLRSAPGQGTSITVRVPGYRWRAQDPT